jgi:dihydrofolate synthase/folylpolyglutamate synthase
MLTSVLSASGIKTGLFTSPHILDFRERARIVQGDSLEYISKDFIWDFCERWHDTFDHLDLSLFEISTMMAFEWFASEGVDVAVIETGLGGRFDSTNIVTPVLSVITNIGLDHCNILGDTLPEIAFEKAGIIKPCVPAVVGESDPEIDPVFERKVLYTNLPEPKFMGSRTEIMSLLTFADKVAPTMWNQHEEILAKMDLQGACHRHNLRTVLAALDVLEVPFDRACVADAIERTAARTDFHGRWERIMTDPTVICDIGHNEHGLRLNMKKLSDMLAGGECGGLVIVYGIMSDKDFDSIAHLLPAEAHYVFTSAPGPRALPAEELARKYAAYCSESGVPCASYQIEQNPVRAMKMALETASGMDKPLVYVGGSTYVVSEVIRLFS